MGGELVADAALIGAVHETDGRCGQGLDLPPIGVGAEEAAVFVRRQHIGSGAGGGDSVLGAGLHDGDIQQGREAGVGAAQPEDDFSPALRDGVHGGEAPAVARALLGPLEGGRHIPRPEGGAVREADKPINLYRSKIYRLL